MNEKLKIIQNDILGQEILLKELCEKYSLSELEMMGIVHELRKLGNNISTEYRGEELYIISQGHNRLDDNSKYYIQTDDDEIEFLLISDLRYGSICEQKSIINDAVQRASDFGCKYVFIAGDISEGIYTGKKKKIFNDSLFAKDVYDQADHISDNHPYIKGLNQYFITGEHDLTHLDSTYIDIGMLIDDQRDDMTYLGQYTKNIVFTNSKNSNEINMILQHSSGSVPYTISYRPQQFVTSIRSDEKVDLILNGHLLTADRFKQRGIYVYSAPSMVDTTPEMRKKGINNVIGAWVIKLKKNEKGELENVSQLFIPYYKTVDNDYLKAKTLRREL